MTLTFDNETYANLLAKYQPKIIQNDEENERAIAIAEELTHKHNKTEEESALLDLLIALIEKFEDEHYPMGNTTPHSLLLHLMEARNLEEVDLVEVINSHELTSEIVSGKRAIAPEQAKVLGKFFDVDPSLFE
ncbi:MAG: helix-turn-helix domain-containing protein [Xenococcaceae cyanobacterium]